MSAPAIERPHGRAKYVTEGCRCDECRTANNAYETRRYRQRGYGRAAFVNAEPVRTHIRNLQAKGMGRRQVAAAAGLPDAQIGYILYGGKSRPPARHVRPGTAAKILAVQFTVTDGTRIDVTGTRRRIQALIAIGWSQAKLAHRLATSETIISDLHRKATVSAGTARAVRALYDELWNTRPPTDTPRQRNSVSYATNRARAKGWPPPMWWDDDEIDTPEPVQ